MKVLKFGGTSVGTVESLTSVKKIVEGRRKPVIIVVSALGGVTDMLISTAKAAAAGEEDTYLETYAKIIKRHHDVIEGTSDRRHSMMSTGCSTNLATYSKA